MHTNAAVVHLMPKPHLVTLNQGNAFALNRTVRLTDPTNCELLQETLAEIGLVSSKDAPATVTVTVVDSIPGSFNHNVAGYPDEAYRLEITPHAINIQVLTPVGTIRAAQTLAQLALDAPHGLQGVTIVDWPAFKVRGFMHDIGRSFLSMDELKEQIDLLSRFKINTFHWHLPTTPAGVWKSRHFHSSPALKPLQGSPVNIIRNRMPGNCRIMPPNAA